MSRGRIARAVARGTTMGCWKRWHSLLLVFVLVGPLAAFVWRPWLGPRAIVVASTALVVVVSGAVLLAQRGDASRRVCVCVCGDTPSHDVSLVARRVASHLAERGARVKLTAAAPGTVTGDDVVGALWLIVVGPEPDASSEFLRWLDASAPAARLRGGNSSRAAEGGSLQKTRPAKPAGSFISQVAVLAVGGEEARKAARHVRRALGRMGVPRECAGTVDLAVDNPSVLQGFEERLWTVVCKGPPGLPSGKEPAVAEDIEDTSAVAHQQLTPKLREVLERQKYKLVGGHSAVKLCRWAKSRLQNRGGCYKLAFYGIESSRCMEATTSLACANRCVFCWRHQRNPVSREWDARWHADDPTSLLEGALAAQADLVRGLGKGERAAAAAEPAHCALSLVGEPVMYPRLGEFLHLLHARRISSFVVTNGQHPDKLAALPAATQLYLSVDAPDEATLMAVDRPVFPDAWERLGQSLDVLARRLERTVVRLTLCGGWNDGVDAVEGYAALVQRGRPCFVEVKGVTFSGDDGGGSPITMEAVPRHADVLNFAQRLAELLPEYEMACEHEHSCCVLLARREFRGRTHIDFDAFYALVEAGGECPAAAYTRPTPSWALWGAPERGFDPADTRHRRAKAHGGKNADAVRDGE